MSKSKPVRLLAGGNPQIAKDDGDAPVQAYIAAMPGWKQDIGKRLDALIVRAVPGVRKAVKWNSPFFGRGGQGWFVAFHVFAHYVKVTFFRGTLLQPVPPGGTGKEARWVDIHEDDFDEARLTAWVKQAAALPGWAPQSTHSGGKSMRKTEASQGRTASSLISQRIADLDDWRGRTLGRMRNLIKEADPDVIEEWKWMGTPVWSHDGILCTGESYKSVVKLTFAKGASVDDPAGLFNASLDGNVRRAIDIREGEDIDAATFKALVRAAINVNSSTRSKSLKPAKSSASTQSSSSSKSSRSSKSSKSSKSSQSAKSAKTSKPTKTSSRKAKS